MGSVGGGEVADSIDAGHVVAIVFQWASGLSHVIAATGYARDGEALRVSDSLDARHYWVDAAALKVDFRGAGFWRATYFVTGLSGS